MRFEIQKLNHEIAADIRPVEIKSYAKLIPYQTRPAYPQKG